MKIKIVTTHISAKLRMQVLIPTLKRYGHFFTQDSSVADLYILDCMRVDHIPEKIIEELSKYKGQLILTSLGDWSSFNTNMNGRGLPDDVINKAKAFAKIQWTKNPNDYDPRIYAKRMTMQPFLIGGLPKPSDIKKSCVLFYGLPTGDLKTENNLRINACRLLYDKPIFRGGIVGQEPGAERDISGVETGRVPRPMYLRMINNSLVSLCLPGNSVLTYRHFESMGLKSCIITCSLDDFQWMNKLVAGRDYLEIKPDLSNLEEVCDIAMKNIDETKSIAENAYGLYQSYYRLMDDGGMTENMWSDISSQFKALGIDL